MLNGEGSLKDKEQDDLRTMEVSRSDASKAEKGLNMS